MFPKVAVKALVDTTTRMRPFATQLGHERFPKSDTH